MLMPAAGEHKGKTEDNGAPLSCGVARLVLDDAVERQGAFMDQSRRNVIKAGLGLGASLLLRAEYVAAQSQPLIQKKIPSSGEAIPIIGIGTARRYEEVKNDSEKVPLRETIRQFQALGGKVIDSSPSYGTAEAVVGELVDGLKVRDSLFLATKVSLRNVGRAEGIKQIDESFKKLRTNRIDLIAVHNLRDTDVQLKTLREMKAGRADSLRRHHHVVR